MRLHKVINREVRGTTYYRWVLAIPPKQVRDLGWVDGQRLDGIARGSTLTLEPSRFVAPRRGTSSSEGLREVAQERVLRRPVPRR